MSEATPPEGTQYEIWVHLFEIGSPDQIGEGSVTISATAHVDALREAVQRLFKNLLKGLDANEFVVKSTAKDAPVDSKKQLYLVPFGRDDEDMLSVCVEVPKKEGTAIAAGSIRESPLALLDPSGKSLDFPPELHQILSVEHDSLDENDRNYAPRQYVVTRACQELIKLFFDNLACDEYGKWKELCIYGIAGCGKSCATKILVGEVKRRLPSARVFYSRKNHHLEACRLPRAQLLQLYHEATAERPVFVFLDELLESEIELYRGLAGGHLYVVFVASAYYKYFFHHSSTQSAKKEVHCFPFDFRGDTLARLTEMWNEQRGGEEKEKVRWPASLNDFQSKYPFSSNEAKSILFDDDTVESRVRLTNGHLLSLAQWLFTNPKFATVDAALRDCQKRILEFWSDKPRFYMSVLQMFRMCARNPVQIYRLPSCQGGVDARFMGSEGEVASPLFLRAYETCLVTSQPPASVLDPAFLSSLDTPSENEWVLTKICTSDECLLSSAGACLKLFGLESFVASVSVSDIVRVPYHSLEDIEGFLSTHKAPPPLTLQVHFLPAQFDQRQQQQRARAILDCLQIYARHDEVVLIGHKVTRRTAQEESKSLALWAQSTKELAALPSIAGKTLHFVLVFSSCEQSTRDSTLHEENQQIVDDVKERHLHLAEYPCLLSLSDSLARALRLDSGTAAMFAPRKLTVEKHSPVLSCTTTTSTTFGVDRGGEEALSYSCDEQGGQRSKKPKLDK